MYVAARQCIQSRTLCLRLTVRLQRQRCAAGLYGPKRRGDDRESLPPRLFSDVLRMKCDTRNPIWMRFVDDMDIFQRVGSGCQGGYYRTSGLQHTGIRKQPLKPSSLRLTSRNPLDNALLRMGLRVKPAMTGWGVTSNGDGSPCVVSWLLRRNSGDLSIAGVSLFYIRFIYASISVIVRAL